MFVMNFVEMVMIFNYGGVKMETMNLMMVVMKDAK